MRKNLNLLTRSTLFAGFLALSLIISSCSWGGDDDATESDIDMIESIDEGTTTQMSEIDEMEAQEGGDVVEEDIFVNVEKMPEFPGGEAALMKYLSENIEYPQQAKDDNIEGKVFVGFVVLQSGNIDHVKVIEGIGGGCDEEAVRVVKSMPSWSPGYEKGVPVKVEYTIPINFTLH